MGFVVWLTGLPGSGKSTIAKEMERLIPGVKILRLDLIRKVLTPEPTYDEEEREGVYTALVDMAVELLKEGKDVIIDATGNRRRWRENARDRIKEFYEVWIRCPIELCMKREAERTDNPTTAELYKKALRGEIENVPGIGVPYENPESPDMIIDSDNLSAKEAAEKIVHFLK